ncbi:MAG: hypothetical protein EG823_01135 [Actinobacteria bacterium]|nr:hypothetical protein [Actinomycetota bacterium]
MKYHVRIVMTALLTLTGMLAGGTICQLALVAAGSGLVSLFGAEASDPLTATLATVAVGALYVALLVSILLVVRRRGADMRGVWAGVIAYPLISVALMLASGRRFPEVAWVAFYTALLAVPVTTFAGLTWLAIGVGTRIRGRRRQLRAFGEASKESL